MVIVPDRVSAWVDKGEIVDRYLNPGDVFDEVHLVMTNGDRPDPAAVQTMAGRAVAHVHNLPSGGRAGFALTAGWWPPLVRAWSASAVRLGRRIRPHLVRCHGVRLNALAGVRIREALGCPLVISVHHQPDTHLRSGTAAQRVIGGLMEATERRALAGSDAAVGVYAPILPYLRRLGAPNPLVIYNAVGRPARKSDYALSGARARVLCVGRQDAGVKDPTPILDAVAADPGLELHLIGTGDLHEALRRRASSLQAGSRVQFTPSLPNDAVLEALSHADLFASASAALEVSKTVLEASLAALPIVVNDRAGGLAEELRAGNVAVVDGTAESFRVALTRLAGDEDERRRLGQAAAAFADTRWDPDRMEATWAALYVDLLERHQDAA